MSRIKAFDGVRGYAAVMVLIYHAILAMNPQLSDQVLYKPIYSMTTFYDLFTKIILTVFNGESAVILFFILSGAVLLQSLVMQTTYQLFILDFTIKRLIRIYLPTAVCVFIFYSLFNSLHFITPLFPHISFIALIKNVTLYQAAIHGASWTLMTEIAAIPLILLAYYGYRKIGKLALISLLAITAAMAINLINFDICYSQLYFIYFSVGFIAIVFPFERYKSIIKQAGWLLPLVAFLFIRTFFDRYWLSPNLLQAGFAGWLLVYLRINHEGKLISILENRFSQFLGKISFSFYLWNVLILNLILPFLSPKVTRLHVLEYGIAISIIVFLITIPIAILSQKYIESYAIQLGKKASFKFLNFVLKFYKQPRIA